MIHQYKVELQERIRNQEKENNHFFQERMWERIIRNFKKIIWEEKK